MKYVPHLLLALFIGAGLFVLGKSCGYRAAEKELAPFLAPDAAQTVSRWDKDSNHHVVTPVIQTAVIPKTVRKEAEKKIEKKGKVESVTDFTVTYPAWYGEDTSGRFPFYLDTSGQLAHQLSVHMEKDHNLMVHFSDSTGWSMQLPWAELVARIKTPPRDTAYLTDSLSVVHYWWRKQLYADISSTKGLVGNVRSFAVYKEPAILWGPSVTVTYFNGRPQLVPGISVVKPIRLGRWLSKRR